MLVWPDVSCLWRVASHLARKPIIYIYSDHQILPYSIQLLLPCRYCVLSSSTTSIYTELTPLKTGHPPDGLTVIWVSLQPFILATPFRITTWVHNPKDLLDYLPDLLVAPACRWSPINLLCDLTSQQSGMAYNFIRMHHQSHSICESHLAWQVWIDSNSLFKQTDKMDTR